MLVKKMSSRNGLNWRENRSKSMKPLTKRDFSSLNLCVNNTFVLMPKIHFPVYHNTNDYILVHTIFLFITKDTYMKSPERGTPITWGIGQIENDLDKVHLGSNTAFLDDEVAYN